MEIERKMDGHGLAEGLTQTSTIRMDQGDVSVRPTVRIRREALCRAGARRWCSALKGGHPGEEIETEIDAELFAKLEHLIGKPLIRK